METVSGDDERSDRNGRESNRKRERCTSKWFGPRRRAQHESESRQRRWKKSEDWSDWAEATIVCSTDQSHKARVFFLLFVVEVNYDREENKCRSDAVLSTITSLRAGLLSFFFFAFLFWNVSMWSTQNCDPFKVTRRLMLVNHRIKKINTMGAWQLTEDRERPDWTARVSWFVCCCPTLSESHPIDRPMRQTATTRPDYWQPEVHLPIPIRCRSREIVLAIERPKHRPPPPAERQVRTEPNRQPAEWFRPFGPNRTDSTIVPPRRMRLYERWSAWSPSTWRQWRPKVKTSRVASFLLN